MDQAQPRLDFSFSMQLPDSRMQLEGDLPHLARKSYRQKSIAFLVTGFSLLAIMSLAWAALIKGYQVRNSITIELPNQASSAEFQSVVARAFRNVSTDSNLNEIVTRLRQQIPVRSQTLLGDSDSLRKSIWAETVAGTEPNVMKLQVVIQGNGSREDRDFLASLTDALKIEVEKVAQSSDLSGQVEIGDLKMAKFRNRLREIQTSVAMLENNYEALCQQINGRQPIGNQPFRSASHRVSSSENRGPDLNQLLQSADGKKIEKELQQLIEETQASVSATQDRIHSEFSIVPIGGPEFKNFLVLIILSVAGGLVTAVHYQPFAYRGFASIPAVSRRLNIPVVATLPINQYNDNETVSNRSFDRKIPWANRLADAASIFFVASLVLIVGFCIFSEEIRLELLRSPFDGVTRMLWFLMGY